MNGAPRTRRKSIMSSITGFVSGERGAMVGPKANWVLKNENSILVFF